MIRAYDDMVADHVADGWRVEQETSTHTLLAKGDPTKHWAHIILTLVTAGIWGIVYGLVLAFGGLKQRRVLKNPDGTGRVEKVH